MGPEIDNGRRQNTGPLMLGTELFFYLGWKFEPHSSLIQEF